MLRCWLPSAPAGVTLFAEYSEETGGHTGLAALLTCLVDRLGLTGERMPLYPAFGGPPVASP